MFDVVGFRKEQAKPENVVVSLEEARVLGCDRSERDHVGSTQQTRSSKCTEDGEKLG
jgi:hypothetical protein